MGKAIQRPYLPVRSKKGSARAVRPRPVNYCDSYRGLLCHTTRPRTPANGETGPYVAPFSLTEERGSGRVDEMGRENTEAIPQGYFGTDRAKDLRQMAFFCRGTGMDTPIHPVAAAITHG